MLGVVVDPLAGRLGGVADAVLRPELLRGAAQAREPAHGPPAHLTIEILAVDSRLRLAEDDHTLHRHGLLMRACVRVSIPRERTYVVVHHHVVGRRDVAAKSREMRRGESSVFPRSVPRIFALTIISTNERIN